MLVGDNPPGGVAAEYAGPAPRPRAGHVVDQTAPVVGIDADGGVLVAHEPAQVIPHRRVRLCLHSRSATNVKYALSFYHIRCANPRVTHPWSTMS